MPAELIDLLKPYARRGLEDWRNAASPLKKTVSLALANKIADDWGAMDTIDAIQADGAHNLKRARFIPMPTLHHGGIQRCFFLPSRASADTVAFDLLLFIQIGKWLGFRFEPADALPSTHGYGHVQMNKSMFWEQIKVDGLLNWIPDSYPAFPIRTSDPVQMFLSMATSVHGCHAGMIELVKQLFPNELIKRERYLEMLTKLS